MALPLCQGCLDRDAFLTAVQAQFATPEARARELATRLGHNATNSSLPPAGQRGLLSLGEAVRSRQAALPLLNRI